MDQKLIPITLLIRLGVVAAIASAVVRSRYFKSVLFRNEVRSARQQINIVLFVGIPVALGVWVRAVVPAFSAADVAFESAIIVGVMGGRLAGVALAALCAVPEGVPVFEYAPRAIKLALVGSGAAEKFQVAHMVCTLLTLHGRLGADAADALAVAVCHAHTRRLRTLVPQPAALPLGQAQR